MGPSFVAARSQSGSAPAPKVVEPSALKKLGVAVTPANATYLPGWPKVDRPD